jgi:hypothetical protein
MITPKVDPYEFLHSIPHVAAKFAWFYDFYKHENKTGSFHQEFIIYSDL